MADEDLGTGSVSIELDESAAETGLERLADRIEQALNRAARDGARRMERQLNQAIRRINPLKLQVTADISAFNSALNDLNNLGSAPIRVVPEVDRATFVAAVQAELAGAEVSITVVPDLSGFDQAVRAHRPPEINVDVDADTDRLRRALSGLGKAAGGLAGLTRTVLTLGAVGIAAAGAATAVGGLVAALAPLSGLLVAYPAILAGVKIALGTLKLALDGVKESFSAALTGSAEEFEKSLEGLSPKAQAAAREVRAMKPAFDNLKQSVQDNFFRQIEGQITETAQALRGPLTSGLTSISGRWGQATRNVLAYVAGARGVSNVRSILKGTDQAMEGFSRTTNRLTAGVLQVGDSLAKAFGPQLASGIETLGTRLGKFLQNAASSGSAVEAVDKSLSAAAQLGDLLGNIGGIISGAFSAADQAGGGFLANLQRITQSFEDFVKSAQGQEALGQIFGTIAEIGKQLGPLLKTVVTQIGAIVATVAPLFQQIGPVLVDVLDTLGDAILALMPAVTTLVTALLTGLDSVVASGALEAIGSAIGGIATALAPLIPLFLEFVTMLGTVLAPILSAVATALMPIVQALAQAFAPVLPIITDALLMLVSALTPFVTMLGQSLAPIIAALAPLLVTLATAFADIVVQVMPLITQLTDALIPVFLALAPAVTQIVDALIPLVQQIVDALIPALPPLVDAFIAVLNSLLPVIPVVADLITALSPLVGWLLKLLGPVVTFAAEVVKWTATEVVIPIIEGIIAVLEGLVQMTFDVIDGVRQFVKGVTGFFSSLYDSVTSTVSDMINAVVTFFRQLPDRAALAALSLLDKLARLFNQAKNTAVKGALSLVNDVVRTVRELPAKALAALGNLGSYLASAGRDLIRGLINGIKAMAGSVGGAIKGVVGDAVQGAKDFLGISSPSRVFYEIGRFVGQGFVNGMTAEIPRIRETADKLVKLITDAFKGQKTRRDENLISYVRETQRELERLTSQREALAERIRAANEFAANTTAAALQSFQLNDLFGRVNEQIKQLRERALSPALVRPVNIVGALTDQVEASAARIRRFNRQIEALAKRGVSRSILSQLIGLGPEAGADLAQQLTTATDAQLRELNKAQSDLEKAAKKFGNDSADRMFDAGKKAADGFLAGLKGQQKAISDLMVEIAKSMQKAIRQALGIKSPSVVFRRIGEFVGLGLDSGIRSMGGRVAGASALLADRVTAGFGSGASLAAVSDPFGTGSGPVVTGPLNAAQRAVQGLSAGSVDNGRVVNVEQGAIVINEVGNAEATAARLMNRLVGAGAMI